jgi:hypothetical protein
VVGIHKRLTTISFWGLDGGKTWPAGGGGGKVADSPPRFGLVGDGAVRRPGGCVEEFVEEQGWAELDDGSRNRVEKELGSGGYGERRAAEHGVCRLCLGCEREEGRRESGGSGRNHLVLNATWIDACMVGHEVCRRRRATHGPSAVPVGPCAPWARRIGLRPSEFSTTRVVHREDTEASVRRSKAGKPRGQRGPDALGAVTTSPISSSIPFKPFRNCKTPKIANKLKNLQKQKL